ncbi:ferredoxin [Bordetella pertussis]|nr:ferredoxin [Bordetella pertussis]
MRAGDGRPADIRIYPLKIENDDIYVDLQA